MVSVTPFCHKHQVGMHLVPAMVDGMGENAILVYSCPVEKCERRYLEDAGGYGRIEGESNFVFISEWGQKASPVELG